MLTDVETAGRLNRFYEAKNALVTGGFGFVGSHAVKKLVEYNARVTVVDIRTEGERDSLLNEKSLKLRDKIQIETGDVTDAAFLRSVVANGEFDLIFHFAAYPTVIEKAVENPCQTIQANTIGLVNLLEAVRSPGLRPHVVLFASTDKVYGELDGESYQEEKTPLRGIGVYDVAKLAADVFARTYHEVFGLPTIVLRMCNLFGPYDFNTDFRLVPKAMKSIYANDPPRPPELYFDSIEHWRDYLYIDDAVRAILLLAYHPHCRGEVYNLSPCRYISTPEMLKAIVEAAAEVERESDEARAEAILKNGIVIGVRPSSPGVVTIKKQHLSADKIKNAIRFEPSVEFKEALFKTVRFYRSWFLRNRSKPNGGQDE